MVSDLNPDRPQPRVDLELHRLIGEGGGDALGKAYQQLIEIYQGAHKAAPDLKQAFEAFQARLDAFVDTVRGFIA